MSDLRISSSTITLRMLKGNRKGHKGCSFLRRTVAISLMDSEFFRQRAVATQPTVRVIKCSHNTSLSSNLQSCLQWGYYLFLHYITQRKKIQLQRGTQSKNNLIKCKRHHNTKQYESKKEDLTVNQELCLVHCVSSVIQILELSKFLKSLGKYMAGFWIFGGRSSTLPTQVQVKSQTPATLL